MFGNGHNCDGVVVSGGSAVSCAGEGESSEGCCGGGGRRLLVMSLCGVVGGRARSDRAVLTPLLQQWSDIVVRKWLLS